MMDTTTVMNNLYADLARVTAERDAAVARNIILHQQKTAEAEAARIDRIPVADFYHRVREVLEAAGVGEDVLDKVRDIPGWDGTEGGYGPGLETTTFVYREELVKAEAERDAALAEVEAMRAVADDLAKLLKMHHVGHGAFDRKGCGVCKPIDAALDALRARKVGG